MSLLIIGLLIWSLAHLSLALKPSMREVAIERIGQLPWKALFALVIATGLALMIAGWRSTLPTSAWVPPGFMRHITFLLVPIAFVLFFAARMPTDLKRVIRHPQLTGVKLWAVAHLLSNGEVRSLVLFGGLLAWAVLEVIFINRRDGKASAKPESVGMVKTLVSTVAALVIAAVVMRFHVYLAGVPLMS